MFQMQNFQGDYLQLLSAAVCRKYVCPQLLATMTPQELEYLSNFSALFCIKETFLKHLS
jgi:hypothetical protein